MTKDSLPNLSVLSTARPSRFNESAGPQQPRRHSSTKTGLSQTGFFSPGVNKDIARLTEDSNRLNKKTQCQTHFKLVALTQKNSLIYLGEMQRRAIFLHQAVVCK